MHLLLNDDGRRAGGNIGDMIARRRLIHVTLKKIERAHDEERENEKNCEHGAGARAIGRREKITPLFVVGRGFGRHGIRILRSDVVNVLTVWHYFPNLSLYICADFWSAA